MCSLVTAECFTLLSISTYFTQVDGLTRDAGRLASENNQLHLQLLAGADAADKADREHYQQVKKLEGQITELACWKHQTSGRFQTLEQENAGLRAKVEEILRLGEKYPRREPPATDSWLLYAYPALPCTP